MQVNATNVSTTGQFSTGIVANRGHQRDGQYSVRRIGDGRLAGRPYERWADLFGLPAAGVILSSTGGTATLTNDGIIGALSDRAVAGDPQVINNGLITGFVQFTGGDNSILNNGTFNLRHFADTDGNTVRDTLRVAIADLGNGPATPSPTTERWRSPQWQAPPRWSARGSISRSGTPTTQWRSAGRCRAT